MKHEEGIATLEFAIVLVFLMTMLIAVCSGADLYFTHNSLIEATRRGARFAALRSAGPGQCVTGTDIGPSVADIQNYTASPLIGLRPSQVHVSYDCFGQRGGTVTVYVSGYTYAFVLPIASRQILLPSYRTTVIGESAGTE